ncbi:PilZ domain-containing protein [Litoreibacter ponti]|uniref:PilZ domain-containing protein n=1 Tax=Litoreibacter ponti TaxID=1510457 RepID=A0A2T6BDZ1_9RHOB|nr:PilZ domain-containing protein [Litoreibacter ponti]PTX54279.1 PilZ domain-containing protein [Litoreibacter ponti]
MKNWRKPRAPARFSVTMRTDGEAHRVVIVNVHEDGAGIYGVPHLEPGTAVDLTFLHHSIPALIMWRHRYTAGVKFDTPISDKMVARIRRLSRSQAA